MEESKNFDTIILNTDKRKAFEPQLKNLKIPIVSLSWIENCILEEKFIEAKEYEIIKPIKPKSSSKGNPLLFTRHTNYLTASSKLKIKPQELEQIMATKDSADKMMSYFTDCVFCIKNLPKDEARLVI